MITICIPATPDRKERVKELIESIVLHTFGVEYIIKVYENEDGGWNPAVMNMLKDVSGLCVVLDSDTIVYPGWLKKLSDAYATAFPNHDGIAFPFNELHGASLCQMPFGDAQTILKYMHSDFVHFYADNYLTLRARKDGKLIYVPDAKIEHRHFVNGKAEKDEAYRRIFDNTEQIEKDRQLFEKLKQEYGL